MEWLNRFVTVMDLISKTNLAGMGITEISSQTGLSKSTLHRMLTDMREHKLITQDELSKRYRLGSKALVWGSQFVVGQDPSGLLSDYCDELAERSGLYTFLCRLDQGEVYCIYTSQPSKMRNKYFVHVGQRMPLHCSAAAKAILAYLPEAQIDFYLCKNGFFRYTDFTRTDKSQLLNEMAEIKHSQIAFCRQELEIGVSAISTTVFRAKQDAVYSISLIGETAFMDQNESKLIDDLRLAGQKASERMRTIYSLTSAKDGKRCNGNM